MSFGLALSLAVLFILVAVVGIRVALLLINGRD